MPPTDEEGDVHAIVHRRACDDVDSAIAAID
jgi:hypothetical protein